MLERLNQTFKGAARRWLPVLTIELSSKDIAHMVAGAPVHPDFSANGYAEAAMVIDRIALTVQSHVQGYAAHPEEAQPFTKALQQLAMNVYCRHYSSPEAVNEEVPLHILKDAVRHRTYLLDTLERMIDRPFFDTEPYDHDTFMELGYCAQSLMSLARRHKIAPFTSRDFTDPLEDILNAYLPQLDLNRNEARQQEIKSWEL